MKVRPVGVSLVAAAFIILGAYYLLWSILLFTSGVFMETYDRVFFEAIADNKMFSAVLGIVTTSVMIITGIGLLQMKKWAWYLAFIGAALMLVNQLFGLNEGNLLWAIVQLVVVALLVFYLVSSDVRATFGIGTTPS